MDGDKAVAVKPARPMLVATIVGCALFMQMLDSTVIATALPVMAKGFHETPVRLNIAITSYMLSVAIFIPISGWVADRFGPRTVFRVAIAFFTISSVLCALSQSLPQLVGARILQGMAGAMMVPVGRIVLLRSVPKVELVQAMSFLSVPALLGPVLGPPLGGFIVTYGAWQWIFLINVPIGLLGIGLVSLFIDEITDNEVRPLDVTGFLLTGIGLAGLMFGFEMMGRGTLPLSGVLGVIALGATCCGLYVLHARRTAYPLIDLGLFRSPSFAAATLGGSLFRLGLGAAPFLLALLLQVGFGLSPLAAGLLTFVSAVGALLMKFTAPPILRRFGFRRVLIANTVIASVAFMSYALFTAATPHAVILGVLLVTGFFRSLQMTSLNALAYADVAQSQMSRASTLSSMAQQFSFSLGVGLAALVLHAGLAWHGRSQMTAGDVAPAFVVIGLLGLVSLFFFVRLPVGVGAELQGPPADPSSRGRPAS